MLEDKPILIIEKHWIVHIKHLFRYMFSSVLSFIMLGGAYIIIKYFGMIFNDMDKWMYIFILCYQLFITWHYLTLWIDDKLDVLMISKLRIKSVEQKGLFRKAISEIVMESISDIKTENTILGNIFNFGNLKIHLESDEMIEMDFVPNVVEIQKRILDIKQSVDSETNESQITTSIPTESTKPKEKYFQIQSLPKNRHLSLKKETHEIMHDMDIITNIDPKESVMPNKSLEDVIAQQNNDTYEKIEVVEKKPTKKDIKMIVDLREIK